VDDRVFYTTIFQLIVGM